jgi:hypothetical protein
MALLQKKVDTARKAFRTFQEILDQPYSKVMRDADHNHSYVFAKDGCARFKVEADGLFESVIERLRFGAYPGLWQI